MSIPSRSTPARARAWTLLLGLSACAGPAWAGLPPGNLGQTSFNDGIAKPGRLFQQFANVYQADTFTDNDGRARPTDNALETLVLATFVGRITEHRVFGAWYGYEMIQPVVFIDADFSPAVRTGNGLGNLTVSPLVLQWPQRSLWGRPFWQRLNLQVQLPTGSYSAQRAINPSTHHWTVSPHYAMTWQFAEGWEFSSRLHYQWSGRNDDPNPRLASRHVQPGQAVHANFAVSRQMGQGWRLGLSGYGLRQTSAERLDGRARADAAERVWALGPALQLGTGRSRVFMHWYHEFEATNRAEGDRVVVRYFQLF